MGEHTSRSAGWGAEEDGPTGGKGRRRRRDRRAAINTGGLIMRDPELVSCAQRAASELERAWSQWRRARGLIEEVSESVASYVAHSIDHPWGRPRVVLGLDAEEARALAALLGKEHAYL
ncbi:hypothetical protein GCM10027176_17520 [Actinoallomurus bryophytorum]